MAKHRQEAGKLGGFENEVRRLQKTPRATNQSITLSIEVADMDVAYRDATARGYPIVYPLTDEPWGVRRFHVVDPNEVVINVMCYQAVQTGQ